MRHIRLVVENEFGVIASSKIFIFYVVGGYRYGVGETEGWHGYVGERVHLQSGQEFTAFRGV